MTTVAFRWFSKLEPRHRCISSLTRPLQTSIAVPSSIGSTGLVTTNVMSFIVVNPLPDPVGTRSEAEGRADLHVQGRLREPFDRLRDHRSDVLHPFAQKSE